MRSSVTAEKAAVQTMNVGHTERSGTVDGD
jgi:hypothetical protein